MAGSVTWDRHAIVAEVHRRGMTLTGIARAAGLAPSACRVALVQRYAGGEHAIAKALGIPHSELFPDRQGRTRRLPIINERQLERRARRFSTGNATHGEGCRTASERAR